jgi:hypothetical protein
MEGKVESFLEIIKHTVFLYSKHISKAVASKIGQEIRAQQDQRLLVGAIFQIMEQEFSFYVPITMDELFRDVSNDDNEEKVIGIELKA